MAQCWIRGTCLGSELNVSVRQFHPTHSSSAPPAPEPTPNYVHAGGLIQQDLTVVIDARICAMEAAIHSQMQAMERRLCASIYDAQSVLIAVAKDPESSCVVTIHSAIRAMEQRLTTTIIGAKSVLIATAKKPESSTVPDDADAVGVCPCQG